MAPRVAGGIALVAALLVAIALATSSWWSGHPRLEGHEIEYKTAHLGLRGGTLCNTGGDGKCKDIPLGGGFVAIGIITTILGVLGVLAIVALGIGGVRAAGKRKQIAKVALAAVGVVAISGIAFVVAKPAGADIPAGAGLVLFWLGLVAAGAAGGVMLWDPAWDPRARAHAPAQAPPGPDLAAMFPEPNAPYPANYQPAYAYQPPGYAPPGTPPPHAPGYAPPPGFSLGGDLPPPPSTPMPFAAPTTDPFALVPKHAVPPPSPADLLGQSRLRPLFDSVDAASAGLVPTNAPTPFATPHVPSAAMDDSTLIPRPPSPAVAAAIAGVPPESLAAPVRATPQPGATVIPLPPIVAPPLPPRTKPASLPPPRGKPASVAPPRSNRVAPTIASPGAPPPIGNKTSLGMAVPPPLAPPPETIDRTDAAASAFAESTSPDAVPSESTSADATPFAEPPNQEAVNEDAETVARERVSASELEPVISSAPRPDQMPRDSVPTLTGETQIKKLPARPPAAVAELDQAAETEVFTGRKPIAAPAVPAVPAAPKLPPPAAAAKPVPPEFGDAVETEVVGKKPIPAPLFATPPAKTAAAEFAAAAETEVVGKKPIADPRAASPVPISTAPQSLAPPTADQVASTGPAPACPQCEAPMAWVEAHLRFYCKPCRMYF